MTGIKPSTHGIVVDHKESQVRYAVSDKNFNPAIHRKVRDLRPGETVLGYQPKRLPASEGSESGSDPVSGTTGEQGGDAASSKDSTGVEQDASQATQTEGSAFAGTKGK